MKKLSFLFTFFVFSYIHSQPYIPVLQEGNQWSVDVYVHILDPPIGIPCCYTATRQFSLGNIEHISGKDYYRVLNDGTPSCLLREENGIVYKYDENDSIDRVLFNFNLEIGDEFNVSESAYAKYPFCSYESGFPYTPLTVENVEVLEIAGKNRKVITFTEYGYFSQFQWIEGIGNITGFDLMWEQIDITDGSLLVCFTTNDTTHFFNNATSCDNTTLGVNNLSSEKIMLYPNPNNGQVSIKTQNELIIKIEAFNLLGKKIKTYTNNLEQINIVDLRAGIYFFKIYTESGVITKQVIKK